MWQRAEVINMFLDAIEIFSSLKWLLGVVGGEESVFPLESNNCFATISLSSLPSTSTDDLMRK